MKRSVKVGVGLAIAVLGAAAYLHNGLSAQDKKDDAALERTRKQVRMLDDIYKSAVVLITDKYVNTDTDYPAGLAAKALFGAIKKKGWHEARLVDVSGDPVAASNAPTGDFEKAAAKALLGGQPTHEQVVEKDNKRFLLAATAVPVVSKKCLMCHENYRTVKEGTPIGMISYIVPVE